MGKPKRPWVLFFEGRDGFIYDFGSATNAWLTTQDIKRKNCKDGTFKVWTRLKASFAPPRG